MASRADAIPMGGTADYSIWRVILASAVGTMIEWYDFYIFGSLAAVLSPIFYPTGNQTFAYSSCGLLAPSSLDESATWSGANMHSS